MLSKHAGFTLMELLMTMVIMGLMAGMAVPTMNSFISSSKVAGLTERIQADMELARTQAILNGTQDVTMTINTATWCYGFDDDADNDPDTICNCNNPATCTVDGAQKVNTVNNFANTTLTTTLPGNTFIFSSSGRPYTLQNSITLSDGAITTTINLTPLGRANPCSNDLPQYNPCN